LEGGGFSRVRINGGPDHAEADADLAMEFSTPLIFGNSMFELNVHPAVSRCRTSIASRNLLSKTPIRFEEGFAIAPTEPGHVLAPKSEILGQWSHPEETTLA